MSKRVAQRFGAWLLVLASGCGQSTVPAKKPDLAAEALQKVSARYPDAEVGSFTRYRLAGLRLFSVSPRRVSARCAPRWIVAVDNTGHLLAKAELLREASKSLSSSDLETRARFCQDMVLNQRGSSILHPKELAERCRSSGKQPAYCQDEARSLVSSPLMVKGRLIYWRSSCADRAPERVEFGTKEPFLKIRSIAALLDARAYARSPAAWARNRLPKISPAARRDLLKRLSCKEPQQRLVLLERAKEDEAAMVRSRALERLSACSTKEIDTLLIKITRRDRSPLVRQRAIELLGAHVLPRGARTLLRAIHRDRRRSTGERYAAHRALRAAQKAKKHSK